MTVHDALFERVRRADPTPPDRHVEVQALRRLVDDRIQFPPPRRRGLAIAIAAALAAAAIVIPIVVLRDADPVPGPVATTAPAPDTTVPETTTAPPTTEPATTTTIAAPSISITWTLVEDPVLQQPGLDITGITVTPSGLIATGAVWAESGVTRLGYPIPTPTATILLSPDGRDWTPVELDSFEGGNAQSVASRGDLVVVAGPAGPDDANLEPRIWASTDAGLTWQTVTPEGDGLLYTVLATDDLLVAAGYGIWVSTDGLEWRKVSDEAIIRNLAETPDGFVAAGQRFTPPPSATTIWESFDGEIWTRARGQGDALETDPNLPSLARDVESADGTALAVGGRATTLNGPTRAAVWRLEEDGTWARLPQNTETFGGAQIVNMAALVNADGLWIAVGDMSDQAMSFSKGRVWASEDGATWFRLDPEGEVFGTYGDGSVRISNLIFDGERLIAVGRRNGVGAIWIGTFDQ